MLAARAVSWATSLGGWFPWLRPNEREFLVYAAEVAAELGPADDDVPRRVIDDGVALVSLSERRQLSKAFVARQPAEWAAVQADAGHLVPLEPAPVAGAVRAAIFERRLPDTRRLDHLERGIAPVDSPCDVLAVTLRAETVWSVFDVLPAMRAASQAASEIGWLRAITAVAHARIHDAHPTRVAALAGRLRRRLPAPGFPRASRLLETAYDLAESQREFAREVALALLAAYVARDASYITSEN